ncbi:Rad52/Rad22 family DNA repair protein [Glutamicibacter protophormiae]|uniref:Rad52/Rad22 family DNA repair protein n=1 Tax=Glutamicibacter protophormiae TaxID=37930 RepID=UPI003A8E55C8
MTNSPEILSGDYITPDQYKQLLAPVNKVRVVHGNKPNMEAYEIRAHLNRVFGFGRWSAEVIAMELVKEWFGKNSNQKDAVYVIYRSAVRLTINSPNGTQLAVYTEWAAGDALGFPIAKTGGAHDFAMKTAESQALKRCAINLGDQFGLSLYNGGSLDALVKGTKNPVLEDGEETAEDVELPAIESEDTDFDHEEGYDAPLPDDAAPMREAPKEAHEAFHVRFEQVKDNPNGLAALGKWARNSGLPEELTNKIKARLAELGL